MRIAVSLVVEVDATKWNDCSGNWATYPTASETRDDVRRYVLNLVQQASLLDESDAAVSLK